MTNNTTLSRSRSPRSRWPIVLAIICAILAVCTAAVLVSPTYEICIAAGPEDGGDSEQQGKSALSIGSAALWVSFCITEAVSANSDLVVALGTVVIAIFTATLWGA